MIQMKNEHYDLQVLDDFYPNYHKQIDRNPRIDQIQTKWIEIKKTKQEITSHGSTVVSIALYVSAANVIHSGVRHNCPKSKNHWVFFFWKKFNSISYVQVLFVYVKYTKKVTK